MPFPHPLRLVGPVRLRGSRWLVIAATGLALAIPSAASAAPPSSTPNSGASGNCVATSSGVLFYRENGIHLGQDVSQFAPHGGQAEYVQGALAKDCSA